MLTTPFLDISSLVSCCPDGLFSIAFDPRYANPGNRYFYVFYSDSPDLSNTSMAIAR